MESTLCHRIVQSVIARRLRKVTKLVSCFRQLSSLTVGCHGCG